MDKQELRNRIEQTADCGCCPVYEDVVNDIVEYFIVRLAYTDGELSSRENLDNEIDVLYNYGRFLEERRISQELDKMLEKTDEE